MNKVTLRLTIFGVTDTQDGGKYDDESRKYQEALSPKIRYRPATVSNPLSEPFDQNHKGREISRKFREPFL
jgi:hypothetical protein